MSERTLTDADVAAIAAALRAEVERIVQAELDAILRQLIRDQG